jgi:ribonuclease P protein component
MRRSEDFRRTVRRGVRAGRRTVVVHALRPVGDPAQPDASPPVAPDRQVGFVVSKSVGSAVRRNRVRRRLRHLASARLLDLPVGTLVVVRALPAAAAAGPELGTDLTAAWDAALSRLARR